jgi:PAS domain S-box-containing protein
MPVAATRCSADLHYVWASRRYAEWLGRSIDDIVGKPISEVLGEEGLEAIRPHIARVLAGETVEYESAIHLKNIGRRWIHAEYAPTVDPSGKVDGWVAAVVDITSRKRAEEKLAANHAALARLFDLSTRPAESEALQDLLQAVIDTAVDITEAHKGTLQLYDEADESLRIVAHRGFEHPFLEHFAVVHEGPAVCGEALRRRSRVFVEDVHESPIFLGTPTMKVMKTAGVRSVLSTLMVSREGKLLGVIATHWTEPLRPDPERLKMLEIMARQAADILEHRQQEDKLRQNQRELLDLRDRLAADLAALTRLHQISTRFLQEGQVTPLLEQFVDVALEVTGADMGNIQFLDPASGELRIAAQRGLTTPFLDFFARAGEGFGACGTAMKNAERVIVEDVTQSAIFVGTPALQVALDAGVRAVQSTPLLTRGGRLVGMISTHYRTPRRPSERHFRLLDLIARQLADLLERSRAEDELREANLRKDQFLAMLGHELRNPLGPILTATHVMKLMGTDSMKRERDIIERQARHLVRLVDDLLDVSRITQAKVVLKRQPVELWEVVAHAIEAASPLFDQRMQRLSVEVPRHGLWVDVDSARMAQVVSNLLTNAARYTSVGGSIKVGAGSTQGEVVLAVEDDGAGISAEMLPRIFEPFTQGPQAVDRAHGGLGLGLTIVRSLVELHGGSVSARSEGAGKGSVFTIRLPRSLREPVPAQGADSSRRKLPMPGMNVLVVDDNEDGAMMLAEALQLSGYNTRVAQDGPMALQVSREFKPEVALLDIGLPVMDGYELARRLRKESGSHNLTLIAVTGYGQDVDRARSREAGFDAHLVKPVDLDALRSLIKRFSTRSSLVGPPGDAR